MFSSGRRSCARQELRDRLKPLRRPYPRDLVSAVEVLWQAMTQAPEDGRTDDGPMSRGMRIVEGIFGLVPDARGSAVHPPDAFGGDAPKFVADTAKKRD